MARSLPYKIAVLCYLFDAQGRVLLLHRVNPPNQDLHSPIGGKLNTAVGESPRACALREIREETGLDIDGRDVHLCGIVTEEGFENNAHWLMFLYEVTKPVELAPCEIREGRLAWHETDAINDLAIPQTDRQVLWPLFWKYRRQFFCVHINCGDGMIQWQLEQSVGQTP